MNRADYAAAYLGGMTVRQIAAASDDSPTVVWGLLRAAGVLMRPAHRTINPHDPKRLRARNLRAAGCTYREIARLMGCGFHTAHKWVNR